jgi:hypothetical protein
LEGNYPNRWTTNADVLCINKRKNLKSIFFKLLV